MEGVQDILDVAVVELQHVVKGHSMSSEERDAEHEDLEEEEAAHRRRGRFFLADILREAVQDGLFPS